MTRKKTQEQETVESLLTKLSAKNSAITKPNKHQFKLHHNGYSNCILVEGDELNQIAATLLAGFLVTQILKDAEYDISKREEAVSFEPFPGNSGQECDIIKAFLKLALALERS